jgi:nitrogen fixation protein FixH
MSMKFNWGTGIFIILTLFFLAIIAFYIYITHLDINLVEDNYYEKELAYQDRIDKLNNTLALPGKINITKETGIIIIQFPDLDPGLSPEGTVLFYRPSDPKKDFTLSLQLNDSLSQAFDISKLDPGRWMLKLDWKMGRKEYYFEEGIFIEH